MAGADPGSRQQADIRAHRIGQSQSSRRRHGSERFQLPLVRVDRRIDRPVHGLTVRRPPRTATCSRCERGAAIPARSGAGAPAAGLAHGCHQPVRAVRGGARPGDHQHPLHDLRPQRSGRRHRPEGARADLPTTGLGRARSGRDLGRAVRKSSRGALDKAAIKASDLAAVGITNQRETTVVWDRTTGKAGVQRHRLAGHPDRRRSSTSSLGTAARTGSGPRSVCRWRRTSPVPRSSGSSTTSTAPGRWPRPVTSSSAPSTPGASGT